MIRAILCGGAYITSSQEESSIPLTAARFSSDERGDRFQLHEQQSTALFEILVFCFACVLSHANAKRDKVLYHFRVGQKKYHLIRLIVI